MYFALIVVEKQARLQHEQLEMLYKKKRVDEKDRWKVAYSLYDKQAIAEQEMGTKPKSAKLPSTMVMLKHTPARKSTKKFARYSSYHSDNRVYSIVS